MDLIGINNMIPIPNKMREEMEADPFMKKCVWSGEISKEKVSWEHCWNYAGRKINEKWAIVPLRVDLNVNISGNVKEYCRYVSLTRATNEDLEKYPKKNWQQLKKYLNKKYEGKKHSDSFL